MGLEPTTPTLPVWCSSQLSYSPEGTADRSAAPGDPPTSSGGEPFLARLGAR